MIPRRRSGLGSLIPGSELSAETTPELVPITSIAVNPYQPRRAFAPEALEELADSIRRHGILQPLTVRVREGGYELIAGERRLQASRRAGLTSVPVIVRDCTDGEMLELALVENLQREDLNAMEAAHSYQQLIDQFGLSQGEVADRVGKSRSAVANTLRLLALPTPIQQAVETGTISEGHARTLLSVDNPDYRNALFKSTIEKGLSVRALEAIASTVPKQSARRTKKSSGQANDPHLQQLRTDMQMVLGTRVVFQPGSSASRGILEIEYYSEDDLSRIYDKLRE
jgi:ParB family chromosome partitioning protein